MMMKTNQLYLQEYNQICNLVNNTSKLDVRLINREGESVFQLTAHTIPVSFQHEVNEYEAMLESLSASAVNTYLYYVNSYGLEYIAAGIWKNHSLEGAIVIGPFVSSIPTINFVIDIVSKNNLPVSERKQLQEFYTSLSVISSSVSGGIGHLLVNLCTNEFVDAQLKTMDSIEVQQNTEQIKVDISKNKHFVEYRYKQEKKLINAIAKGDKEEIQNLKLDINDVYLEKRIPESPLRSNKNLSLVLNTLCRVAAERGKVHPVYIDEISNKFAILVERAPNLPRLKQLNILMINEYCDLVKEYSTRMYSHIVRNAIDYIKLNLENPLTLKEIADAVHVNASHLSRKFKKETNVSIVDFINMNRVETAKLYLQGGNITITDVAFMVGYNDVNYFSRVFKKITSMTPSQFIQDKTVEA
ncbi:MAG: helix-turn-helix transcriptional regulator [Bacillus sp. (in: firmicutes)]